MSTLWVGVQFILDKVHLTSELLEGNFLLNKNCPFVCCCQVVFMRRQYAVLKVQFQLEYEALGLGRWWLVNTDFTILEQRLFCKIISCENIQYCKKLLSGWLNCSKSLHVVCQQHRVLQQSPCCLLVPQGTVVVCMLFASTTRYCSSLLVVCQYHWVLQQSPCCLLVPLGAVVVSLLFASTTWYCISLLVVCQYHKVLQIVLHHYI